MFSQAYLSAQECGYRYICCPQFEGPCRLSLSVVIYCPRLSAFTVSAPSECPHCLSPSVAMYCPSPSLTVHTVCKRLSPSTVPVCRYLLSPPQSEGPHRLSLSVTMYRPRPSLRVHMSSIVPLNLVVSPIQKQSGRDDSRSCSAHAQ